MGTGTPRVPWVIRVTPTSGHGVVVTTRVMHTGPAVTCQRHPSWAPAPRSLPVRAAVPVWKEVLMSDQRPLAMVTGGSSGIGFELAKQFARHGYDVALSGSSDRVHEAATGIEELGACLLYTSPSPRDRG